MIGVDPIMLKISQEFYHIDRVLGSCYTIEQLDNAQNWITQVINRWDFIFEPIPMRIYNKRYKEIIKYILSSLQNKCNSMKKAFKEQEEKEKEPKYTKIVKIRGFE